MGDGRECLARILNETFSYEATELLENADFYGLQEAKVLEGQAGKLDVNVSVFRNPPKLPASSLYNRSSLTP
jgi:hypothetical protein